MKKKLLVLVVALLLIASIVFLAACGRTKSPAMVKDALERAGWTTVVSETADGDTMLTVTKDGHRGFAAYTKSINKIKEAAELLKMKTKDNWAYNGDDEFIKAIEKALTSPSSDDEP